MKEEEKPDVEPDEVSANTVTPSFKGRQSFRQVRRELTEEELSTPAAQRLLLDELDRLDTENNELKSFQEKFHAADKKVGVLDEKLKRLTALEIISSGSLLAGALALGYAPKVWGTGPTGPILVSLGVILVAAGIWAKAVQS
jgi:hypothetical protein